jgi:hypothetical protein
MKRNALLALAFLTAAWSGRADAAFSPAGIFAPQAQSSDGGASGDGGGTGKVRWRPKIPPVMPPMALNCPIPVIENSTD